MNKLKPYTIGLICSLIFHLPFVYYYFNITLFPIKEVSILIDPFIVECSLTPPSRKYCATRTKIPPMTLPPRDS